MPSIWSLRNDTQAVQKDLDAWGVNNLSRQLSNQAVDLVTFQRDGATMESIQEFNNGDIIIITRNSVRWFYGRVTKITRSAAPQSESLQYEVSGPYWYLQNLIYEQTWATPTTPSNPSSPLTTMNKTRCILNQSAAGAKINTGAQISAVVNFAIGKGAPITLGSVDPAVSPRFSEVLDLACSEVIAQQIRWSPDAVMFFDYSTTPFPTLHVRLRPNITNVGKPLDTALATGISITPRHDLQIPGIRIAYEQTNSIDEVSWSVITLDTAGTDTFGTVKLTIELGGGQASYQRQSVTSVGFDANSTAFWIGKNSWLASVTGLTVTGGAISGGGSTGSELTAGACPPWLAATTGPATVTATLSYTFTNADGASETVDKRPFSAHVTKTTLATGSYSRLQSFTAAEAVPTGVAASFFAAANFLHYEGTVTFTEEECTGDARPGTKISLTGGLAAWATMEALVQQTDENVDLGTTSVRFGPPAHISVADFIELIRVQRGARASWRLQERVDGKATGGKAESEGSTQMSNENSSNASGGVKRQILKTTGDTRSIDINIADLIAMNLLSGDMKCRIIDVCDGDPPVAKKMGVIGTLPWVP